MTFRTYLLKYKGPKCQQGNDKILTHDFVHRLHLEIFDMNYYPPELVDWWMDDWISCK